MRKDYIEADIRNDYRKLTNLLIERGITITTMESATSGQIASLITDTEGASKVLKGAFITYSNEAKIMQGVSKKVIEKYSVYSRETAIEMAKVCAKNYGANIGIGVTGTMGNVDENNREASIPGEVFFGIYMNGEVNAYNVKIAPRETRLEYKMAVAKEIYDVLMERLGWVEVPDLKINEDDNNLLCKKCVTDIDATHFLCII